MLRLFCGAVALMSTIGLAAMEGGPKPMRPNRTTSVVGADPLPDCNSAPTLNPLNTPCPVGKYNGSSCGTDYPNGLGPVAKGGYKTLRFEYNLAKPVCRKYSPVECGALYEFDPANKYACKHIYVP